MRQFESMEDGEASATATVAVPLQAGSQYQFGGAFQSTLNVSYNGSACQVSALIVRTA